MGYWKRITVLVIGLLALSVGPALAVPVIDGVITGTEWDAFVMQGFDLPEALIPDSYDLTEMRVITESGGAAADDGLYILLKTVAAPSLVDTGVGPPPALVAVLFDYNGDLDFIDAVDRFTTHTLAGGFNVFDGTGALVFAGGAGNSALGPSVIEYFIPVAGDPGIIPLPGTAAAFAIYDNGGDAPDDRLPDVGFITPVPEPGSALLFGFGMAGAAGLRRIRRKLARS